MRRRMTENRGARAGRIRPHPARHGPGGAYPCLSRRGQRPDLEWQHQRPWGTAANWTPNTVPNSAGASVIITSGTNNPVLIDINPTIANLTLGGESR